MARLGCTRSTSPLRMEAASAAWKGRATSLYCTRTSTLLVGAAKRDLACLKLLVEADAQADTRRRRLPGCDKKACEAAVEAGQLEGLVLLRQRGARWSPATKALAAERLGYEEAASEEEEEEDHPYTDDYEDDDYAFEENEEYQERKGEEERLQERGRGSRRSFNSLRFF